MEIGDLVKYHNPLSDEIGMVYKIVEMEFESGWCKLEAQVAMTIKPTYVSNIEELDYADYSDTMKTVEDVKDFFELIIYKFNVGASFHPDTDFKEYQIVNADGELINLFGDEPCGAAGQLNMDMEKAFEVCRNHNKDIYSVALTMVQEYQKHFS